ncbi:SdrD B-like domain-containing protein [Plantibacter sp. M259]|uniref:SdrD B-like domain-containing protein n=1 Tax=Plantibacter sp. M259 TaxID=2583822 RepID=UPI0011104375|nr:SdrD B-like domain-containing protein [Plantibacter sp. M259]
MSSPLRPRGRRAVPLQTSAVLALVALMTGALASPAAAAAASPEPPAESSVPSAGDVPEGSTDESPSNESSDDADEPAQTPSPTTAETPPATDPVATPAATPADIDLALRIALAGVTTGTAPFDADDAPGHDSSATNDIVRTHDTITYRVEVQLDGAASDDRVVVRQVLPEGLLWPSVAGLPAYCGAGSTVSDDRLVLDCVLSGVLPNSVTTYDLVASAASVANGSVLAAVPGAISATATDAASGSPATDATDIPSVTASSGPRVNLGVRPAVVSNTSSQGGVPGFLVHYDAYLDLAGYNAAGGLGARGQSNVVDDVTFVVDLDEVSPNSRLSDKTVCAAGAHEGRVFPKVGGGGDNAVSDSGTWTCRIDLSDPRRIIVTVSGADLSADHIPTKTANGAAIPLRGYLALGRFGIFTPRDDVPADGSLNTRIHVRDFVATGTDASGGPVPNAQEPLDDNTATANLIRRPDGTHATRYVGETLTELVPVPGQFLPGTGDGVVVPGQQYRALTMYNNRGGTEFTGQLFCQAFDTKTQHVAVGLDGVPARAHGSTDIVIEYGTRPTVDETADDATRWKQMNDTTCDDGDDVWTTDLSSIAVEDITKIRYRSTNGVIAIGASLMASLTLEMNEGVPAGTLLAESYSLYSPEQFPDDRDTSKWYAKDGWYHSKYDPSQVSNADFPRGDRLTAANAVISIGKRAIVPAVDPGSPAQLLAGERVRFEVTPQITSVPGQGDAARDVVVVDRLPAGLVYDPTDVSHVPESVETAEDGSTLITWRLGQVARGSEPVIRYWATSDATVQGDLVNQVVVSSPDDPGSLDEVPTDPAVQDAHYGRQTVSLRAPGGLRVQKSVEQRVVESGDHIDYRLAYANMNATGAQEDVALVDVLPFVGDSRGSTADGVLAGEVDAPDGDRVRYTSADPAAVQATSGVGAETGYGDLPAGFTWCSFDEFGAESCPTSLADVTAFRVETAELDALERHEIVVELTTDGAVSGAEYRNDATVRSASQTLGARSPLVATTVVSSSIGERLWWDRDGDGIDDDGADGQPGDGVAGVPLRLTGVDKHGAEVSEQTETDADGRYRFSGLVSGTYSIRVDLPEGAGITGFRIGDDGLVNSALDPQSSTMEDIVVADPSPTGADRVDLTWNGGIVEVELPVTPPVTDPEGPKEPSEPTPTETPQATPERASGTQGPLATTGVLWLDQAVIAAMLLLVIGGTALLVRSRRARGGAEESRG